MSYLTLVRYFSCILVSGVLLYTNPYRALPEARKKSLHLKVRGLGVCPEAWVKFWVFQ